jgi:uncharacterized protein (DUF736 family)
VKGKEQMTTQIECGVLKPKKLANGGATYFEGNISLSGVLVGTLVLMPHPRANPENENAPSYEAALTEHGKRPFIAGAAWIKNSDKVKGGDFLSITLDAVKWDRAINVAAFPPEDEQSTDWRIVWSRPKGVRVQDQYFDQGAE